MQAYENIYGCSILKVPNPDVTLYTKIGENVLITTKDQTIESFPTLSETVQPAPVKRTVQVSISDQFVAENFSMETYLEQLFFKDLVKVVKRIKNEVNSVFLNPWMETFYIKEYEIYQTHDYAHYHTDYKIEYFFSFFAHLGYSKDKENLSNIPWSINGH